MRGITLALGIIGAILTATPAVQAESPPASPAALNPASIVNGDIIHLGDIFTGLPDDKARVSIAYAPRPGERLVLDAQRLMDIARSQGVAWAPQSRFDRAVVERASRLVAREEIAAAISNGLQKYGLKKGDEVAFDNENLRIFVPADSHAAAQLSDLRYDLQNRRFSAFLKLDPRATESTLTITGRVIHMISLPVPARQLNRDDVIGKHDLQLVQVAADRLDSTVATEESQLVGMAARHLLRPGDPVRVSDVQPPILVTRGALVTMVYEMPNMTITIRVKAVQDGAKGETIRVMNVESKRELEAVVASADTVVVQPVKTTAAIN